MKKLSLTYTGSTAPCMPPSTLLGQINKRGISCTFSVVSHGHSALVVRLLDSLINLDFTDWREVEVILTLNISEPELVSLLNIKSWPFDLRLIHNIRPQGFGANHNQAFQQARGQWFGVINPDIIWLDKFLPRQDSFSVWLESVPSSIGVVAPAQVDMLGQAQDSMRQLITPWSVVARTSRRLLRLQQTSGVAGCVESADWVNGACLFIRSDIYRALSGFDERYFMYCEDADLCLRLQLAGFKMAQADIAVTHDAQRNTTRKPIHLWWHVTSLLRFWCSPVFWEYLLKKRRIIF